MSSHAVLPPDEKIEGYAVLPMPVKGFEGLSLREKMAAYHLYQAAAAGRDISFDQNHRHNLSIRKLCEGIVLHPQGIDPDVMRDVAAYLKLQYLNGGIHGKMTYSKLLPPASLTPEKLREAAEKARANGAALDGIRLADLEPTIFRLEVDRFSTSRTVTDGQDLLSANANQFYERGLTLKDLENFEEKYVINSRVVRKNGALEELVWRAGDLSKGVPAGLYARELGGVIVHLEKAIPFAGPEQAESLRRLIEFYRTGDNETLKAFNIAWLRYNEPTVDTINGFIEEYRDPREKKGAWEGQVFFTDREGSAWLREVTDHADEYESRAPFDERYKRKGVKPVANMVEVLVGTGDAGPICWSGINLPNDQGLRQEYGSKNILLWNARRAKEGTAGETWTREFIWAPDREIVWRHREACAEILVGFHEALGHASGQKSARMKGEPRDHLPGVYSWIEEERADLVALHHAWDPLTFKIRKDWTEEAAAALYKRYPASELMNLAEVPADLKALEEPHAVGGNFAIRYFMKKWNVVEEIRETVDGQRKTFWIVRDEKIPAMREAVAELLAELQRIKSEGDLRGALRLAEEYGATEFDATLAAEIRARKKALNLPSFYAYVFPEPEIVSKNGKPADVVLRYPKSFLHQQMRWSGYSEEELARI